MEESIIQIILLAGATKGSTKLIAAGLDTIVDRLNLLEFQQY